MRRPKIACLLLPALAVGTAWAAADTPPAEIFTNEGVVALADAGYSEAFIVLKIQSSSRTHFDVSTAGLIYLRRNAISEHLARVILDHETPQLTSAPSPTIPAVAQNVVKPISTRETHWWR